MPTKTKKPNRMSTLRPQTASKRPRIGVANNTTSYEYKPRELGIGRPIKLTPELIEEICKYLANDGLPIMHVCAMIYISESTWYTWERRGHNALEGRPESSAEIEGLFATFYQETRKAIATYQLNKLNTSLNTKAYAPNWVRDMTILERRDRANWGRSDTVATNRGVVGPDEKFL